MKVSTFETDDRTIREEWLVGGRKRVVHVGTVGIRGQHPAKIREASFWFPRFQNMIESHALVPGRHWVRLFYAQHKGKTSACEILLDNEIWQEAQEEISALGWPTSGEYCSIRLFLNLQDKEIIQPTNPLCS